jgi:hypothetical protein
MLGMTTLFASVPLKDMDPFALTMAIFDEIRTIPGVDGVALSKVISAASYLHLNQTRVNRKGLPRTSYIEHPLRNGLRVLRWGVTSEAVLVGLLLHDTVEDCLDRVLDAFVPGLHVGIPGSSESARCRARICPWDSSRKYVSVLRFMAPEYMQGRDASVATDVFSWGAMMGFAMTGLLPDGDQPEHILMDLVSRGRLDARFLQGA